MLKTLLIDDEKPCLDRLSFLLQQRCADSVQLVGQCQTIDESLAAIQTLKPDLVLLDVELKLDGNQTCFDLLGGVVQIDFNVIFVTGYEQYALRAFNVDAIDYLLKPVDADKLAKAVRKVQTRSPIESTYYQQQLGQAIVEKPDRKIGYISIPTADGRNFVRVSDIVHCRSDGNYTELHGLRKYKDVPNLLGILSNPLSEFEKELADPNFYRIHDSHLINLAYLKKYLKGREGQVARGGQVVMTDDVTVLDVAVSKKAGFKKRTQSGVF